MTTKNTQSIEITTKNTGSLTMGIASVVVGVLALLVGWIPFLGLLAIPAAIIGILLSGIGVVLALVKRGKGIGLPLLGGMICIAALLLPILSTGGASAAVSQSLAETSARSSSPAGTPNPIAAGTKQHDASKSKSEKDDYIHGKISLYEVEVKYRESALNGRIPGVTFKLKNLGDRSLDNVEVTIYFKDASGAVIFEEEFNPVLVSSFSMGDNKPLKPGYVWQMESGKFYAAKQVPSEWADGSYEAKITDIIFSK
jgi:hypothetical protein